MATGYVPKLLHFLAEFPASSKVTHLKLPLVGCLMASKPVGIWRHSALTETDPTSWSKECTAVPYFVHSIVLEAEASWQTIDDGPPDVLLISRRFMAVVPSLWLASHCYKSRRFLVDYFCILFCR